jgi:hypothetical protein
MGKPTCHPQNPSHRTSLQVRPIPFDYQCELKYLLVTFGPQIVQHMNAEIYIRQTNDSTNGHVAPFVKLPQHPTNLPPKVIDPRRLSPGYYVALVCILVFWMITPGSV